MAARRIIDISFYQRDTVRVARELLGTILVRETPEGILSGRIVETEAYTGPGDPASHASRGPTPRSTIMFGPPGYAYVYFCYGMHHLLNLVTEVEGVAGAVLIRALEPRTGIKRMRENRGWNKPSGLADGPGKITQALEIDLDFNGYDLTRGETLYLIGKESRRRETVITGPRVGIKQGLDRPWRFRLVPEVSP
jgi:DNA-3-methyladenine glycosylase